MICNPTGSLSVIPQGNDSAGAPVRFCGALSRVNAAVDATSGREIWLYDPHVAERADRMRASFNHSRGIALWRDKVILATWDGRLIAVDAATGREQ
jgi:glucose dehydrogenase